MQSKHDPITLEIYWSRLIAVADEAASALLRTAFSTIIRESNDYVTCLLNAKGESLVECRVLLHCDVDLFSKVIGVRPKIIFRDLLQNSSQATKDIANSQI